MALLPLSAAEDDSVHLALSTSWAETIVRWQRSFGRHDLPWQVADPYRVWISEIMLQQTQVETVKSYFSIFIKRFPTLKSLAAAPEATVLKYWAGLGYYSRARNLHHTAKALYEAPAIPTHREAWEQFKGIGRSTAAAIVAFAFNKREAILDGNVKRILARVLADPRDFSDKKNERKLWEIATALLPSDTALMPAYTQGMMDLGATICTPKAPSCALCPVTSCCAAYQSGCPEAYPVKAKRRVAVKPLTLFWPLVLDSRKNIYLAECPPGIWQNLLTPPAFSTRDAMDDWLNKTGGEDLKPGRTHTLKHRLTHRALTIYAYEFSLGAAPHPNLPAGRFYAPAEIIRDRIPKPLKTLVRYWYLGEKE